MMPAHGGVQMFDSESLLDKTAQWLGSTANGRLLLESSFFVSARFSTAGFTWPGGRTNPRVGSAYARRPVVECILCAGALLHHSDGEKQWPKGTQLDVIRGRKTSHDASSEAVYGRRDTTAANSASRG